LLSKWKRVARDLAQQLGRPASDEEIAEALKFQSKKIRLVLNALLARALKQTDGNAGAAAGRCLLDSVPDQSAAMLEPQFKESEIWQKILKRFKQMTPRQAIVIRLRFGLYEGPPLTLKEIGERLGGMTQVRVRQIQAQGFSRFSDLRDSEAEASIPNGKKGKKSSSSKPEHNGMRIPRVKKAKSSTQPAVLSENSEYYQVDSEVEFEFGNAMINFRCRIGHYPTPGEILAEAERVFSYQQGAQRNAADTESAAQEFAIALEDYKENSKRLFLTWSEVLEVMVNLGYQKASAIPKPSDTNGTMMEREISLSAVVA
jgi:hypothetical protein